tara:strand:+ start:1122 stop:1826 length:705 start_codon:yes stop_codon:yes gene_type:complete
MKKKIRRTRGKSRKLYFTQEHENAIVEYALSDSVRERTDLYVKWIQPAFNEMVDKIVFTYKFTNLPNVDSLKEECKVWLTTILDKYDPNKGSKAFSYFSVITKNWFIHKVKKNAARTKREVHYDELPANVTLEEQLITHNEYHEKRENLEFWTLLIVEVDSWFKMELRPNEKKVVEAIKILMSQTESIEIFNKKAIYLYLREITGLNTKQVVNNLNKIRKRYKSFKEKWDNHKL